MQKASSVVLLVTGAAIATAFWWFSQGRKKDSQGERLVDGYSVHRNISITDFVGSKIATHIKPIAWASVLLLIVFRLFSPRQDGEGVPPTTVATAARQDESGGGGGGVLGAISDFLNPVLKDMMKAATGDADWVAPQRLVGESGEDTDADDFPTEWRPRGRRAAPIEAPGRPVEVSEWAREPAKIESRGPAEVPEWTYEPGPSRAPPIASPYVTGKRSSHGEEECRRVLERVFERQFPSVRPKWLRNPESNMPLELDCYNSEYGIAVEYQGEQHYHRVPKFHRTEDEFLRQKRRDAYKRQLCQDHNIHLIEVPYWVPRHGIENFLIEKLRIIGAVV